LEAEFDFDMGEEARIVVELCIFGEEDAVLPEELEVLYEALVDGLVDVFCPMEIFHVAGVPFITPFDTAIGDVKAKDAPVSKGSLFGVDGMVLCPFEEVQDHLLCEWTLLFGHALPFFVISDGIGNGLVCLARDGVDEYGLMPLTNCLEVSGSGLEVLPYGGSFD
jgi:hypothetical protein